MFSKKITFSSGSLNKSSLLILKMSSLIKLTLVVIFFSKQSQIGLRERSLLNLPLGRPTWEIIKIFEFLLIKNSRTGIILIILVSSIMLPFFKGTFRSNLNKTLLLLRFSQSLISVSYTHLTLPTRLMV